MVIGYPNVVQCWLCKITLNMRSDLTLRIKFKISKAKISKIIDSQNLD
jgi:hypothetical protein